MIKNKAVGDWRITRYGLEHTWPDYQIHRERLSEDWEWQMSGKNWVDMTIFKRALKEARKIHGWGVKNG